MEVKLINPNPDKIMKALATAYAAKIERETGKTVKVEIRRRDEENC